MGLHFGLRRRSSDLWDCVFSWNEITWFCRNRDVEGTTCQLSLERKFESWLHVWTSALLSSSYRGNVRCEEKLAKQKCLFREYTRHSDVKRVNIFAH
mmetsp:Transcript_14868/g.32049  ORF Transcript_14868/g.32049 Transcript_14868/m.32049 type:complete len:97 (+) Transcript_14868:655-945(+)